MDWEYPTQRGGKPEDKQAFIRLLQDLKAVLSANGMILTAALSAGPNTIEPAYDIAAMGQALDYLHVMTYDYHGIWDPVTGPNSPISAAPGEMSIESTMKLYIDAGVPREKIILGIPLYGHTFLMNDASNPGFGVPSQGWSFAGPWTNQAGMMGYNEVINNTLLSHTTNTFIVNLFRISITIYFHVTCPKNILKTNKF